MAQPLYTVNSLSLIFHLLVLVTVKISRIISQLARQSRRLVRQATAKLIVPLIKP